MEAAKAGRRPFELTNRFVFATLVVLGLALYANSFGNRMFWDDDDSILNNEYVHDWRRIPDYFTKNLIAGAGLVDNYWRPMLLLTYSVEWHAWEAWPPGYHAVNTAFHIVDAILLFLVLFAVFRSRWLSFLTSLVFLAHPLQTEAVTYAAGLGDSLSVFFVLSGVLLHLRWRESGSPGVRSGRYWAAAGLYALALMSKETAIVMPAYVFIADFFRQDGSWRKLGIGARFRKAFSALWPYFILAGVYLLLRATALNFQNTFNLYNEANEFTENFFIRLFTFWRVLAIYAGLLFAPFGLHMERTVEIARTLWSPDVIIGGLLFSGLLAAAFGLVRRAPVASFGAFWVLIGLAPTSNLAVPVNGLIYEHWLYLPLAGVFLVIIRFGERIAATPLRRKVLLAIFLSFLLFLSVLTVARNTVWRDPIMFYNDVIRHNDQSYRVWNNLGNAYSDAKLFDEAIAGYEKAIALDPDNSVAYFNLANALRDLGRNNLAIENYRRAIELQPEIHFYHNNLAALFLVLGRDGEARETLEGYLEVAAYKTNTYVSLIKIALRQGDRDAASEYLQEALAADPGDPRLAELAEQLEAGGNFSR